VTFLVWVSFVDLSVTASRLWRDSIETLWLKKIIFQFRKFVEALSSIVEIVAGFGVKQISPQSICRRK
jgi:hypothetical protein